MKIDAKYVKRKELSTYLSPSVLKKEKKVSVVPLGREKLAKCEIKLLQSSSSG